MYQAQMDKTITTAQLGRDMRTLYMMQGSRVRFGPGQSGLGIDEPSFSYQYTARLIGGCPGFQSPRQDASGLVFGYSQETIAEYACAPGAAINLLPQGNDYSVESLLTHQMNVIFGRDPTPDEIAVFSNASMQCTQDTCNAGEIARSICTGLLGSAEMLFY
jgi:hypothetical protein